jgi:hypothetical protein
MWNTKIKVFLIMNLATTFICGQDGLSFFHAKSEIVIERNGEKQDFTAHIRYNLKDTLWVSFTGAFGIEGARMLVTKDSTYIINKIEKTNMAFFCRRRKLSNTLRILLGGLESPSSQYPSHTRLKR